MFNEGTVYLSVIKIGNPWRAGNVIPMEHEEQGPTDPVYCKWCGTETLLEPKIKQLCGTEIFNRGR